MSHKATNWAFEQRGLTPSEKLVLLCLADRHNPDQGCFPQQKTIAEDANIGRSQLNVILGNLEEKGLIRRVRRFNPETKRQRSTRYILRFEKAFAQEPSPEIGHGSDGTDSEQNGEPCPDIGHGAESDLRGEPSPVSGPSRVRISDSLNPVKEPVKEPARAPACRHARTPAREGDPPPDQAKPCEPFSGDEKPKTKLDLVAEWVRDGRRVPQSFLSDRELDQLIALGKISEEQAVSAGLSDGRNRRVG